MNIIKQNSLLWFNYIIFTILLNHYYLRRVSDDLMGSVLLNSCFPRTGPAVPCSVQSGREDRVGLQHVFLPGEGEVCLDHIRRQTDFRHYWYTGQRICAGLWQSDEESRKHHTVQSNLWKGDKTGLNKDWSLLWVPCMFSVSLKLQ